MYTRFCFRWALRAMLVDLVLMLGLAVPCLVPHTAKNPYNQSVEQKVILAAVELHRPLAPWAQAKVETAFIERGIPWTGGREAALAAVILASAATAGLWALFLAWCWCWLVIERAPTLKKDFKRSLQIWSRNGGAWKVRARVLSHEDEEGKHNAVVLLQARLRAEAPDLGVLIERRDRCLAFLPKCPHDSELLAVLGEATLAIEQKGAFYPEGEALKLGERFILRSFEQDYRSLDQQASLLRWDLGDASQQLRAADAIRRVEPLHAALLNWELLRDYELGRPAASLLPRVVTSLPRTGLEGRALQARLLAELGRSREAEEAWEDLLRLSAQDRRFWRQAIDSLRRHGQTRSADALLERVRARTDARPPLADWLYGHNGTPQAGPAWPRRARIALIALILGFSVATLWVWPWLKPRLTFNEHFHSAFEGDWKAVAMIRSDGSYVPFNVPLPPELWCSIPSEGADYVTWLNAARSYRLSLLTDGSARFSPLPKASVVWHHEFGRQDLLLHLEDEDSTWWAEGRMAPSGVELWLKDWTLGLLFQSASNAAAGVPESPWYNPPTVLRTVEGTFTLSGDRVIREVRLNLHKDKYAPTPLDLLPPTEHPLVPAEFEGLTPTPQSFPDQPYDIGAPPPLLRPVQRLGWVDDY